MTPSIGRDELDGLWRAFAVISINARFDLYSLFFCTRYKRVFSFFLVSHRGIFPDNFSAGRFHHGRFFRSLLQRKGHAEDRLSADHRRRAALLHVPRDGQLDPVSVQASVHVHLQPRSRWLQKSRFHGRGVHPGLQAVVPVPGVSGRRRIREHAWVITPFFLFL